MAGYHYCVPKGTLFATDAKSPVRDGTGVAHYAVRHDEMVGYATANVTTRYFANDGKSPVRDGIGVAHYAAVPEVRRNGGLGSHPHGWRAFRYATSVAFGKTFHEKRRFVRYARFFKHDTDLFGKRDMPMVLLLIVHVCLDLRNCRRHIRKRPIPALPMKLTMQIPFVYPS